MANIHPRLRFDEITMIRDQLDQRAQRGLDLALATQNRFLNTILVWKRGGYLNGARLAIVLGHLVKRLLPSDLDEITELVYSVVHMVPRVDVYVRPHAIEGLDYNARNNYLFQWLGVFTDQMARIPLVNTPEWLPNNIMRVRFDVDQVIQDPHEYVVHLHTDRGRAMANRLFEELS